MRNSTNKQDCGFESSWALACAAIVFALLALKIFPLSLWLDECVTYWIVSDGFSSAIERAVIYQGQSPFYYLTALASLSIFGKSEIALRLPSFLAIVISAWLIWLIAKEMVGRSGALFAPLLFLSRDDVLRALSARPYALGIACLCCSVLALLKWIRTGKLPWLAFFIVSAVGVWYSHFLFAPVGLVYLAMIWLLPRHERAKLGYFLISVIAALILALPGLAQFMSLLQRKESLIIAASPTVIDLLKAFTPTDLIVLVSVGLICALIFIKNAKPKFSQAFSQGSLAVLILWTVLPPLFLFSWSAATGSSLFLGRYYMWYLPPLIILCSGLLGSLANPVALRVAVVSITLLVCVKDLSTKLIAEDWRAAASVVNADKANEGKVVLLSSGLIEAKIPGWLTNPEQISYLTSPFSFYPVSARVIALPPDISAPGYAEYLNTQVLPLLVANPGSKLVALERKVDAKGNLTASVVTDYNTVLAKSGLQAKELGFFGQVGVFDIVKADSK